MWLITIVGEYFSNIGRLSNMSSKIVNFFNIFAPQREFREALEAKWKSLYRMAFSWCHDTHLAGDLVQEAFSKAIRQKDQLKNKAAFDAWIYTILANCWRDHCRRQKETVDIDDVELIDESDPELDSHRMEIIQSVRSALAKLSNDQRQIVTLIDLEGFSYNEVAEILSIPIGTVMSRLCRARRHMRHHLKADDTLNPANVIQFGVFNDRR